MTDIGAGLDYLHGSGRVHRDLKPGNVLRAGDRWKLADFGLVRDLSQSGVYHLQNLVGSPRYMAPEFFSDGMVGAPADIWAVGVIVHEVMTGRTVHTGEGPAYIHSVTTQAPSIAPGLPPSTENLIRRCLATDPVDRPTASQLAPLLAGTGRPNPADLGSPAAPDRTDDQTARVAPPSVAMPSSTSADTSVTAGPVGDDPASSAPPAFAPPAPVSAADGGSVLPPAPTGQSSSRRRRLGLVAAVGAVAALALAGWAIFGRGGDDGETEVASVDAPGLRSSAGDPPSDDVDRETSVEEAGDGGVDEDDEGAASDEDDPAAPEARSMVALDEFTPDQCADIEDTDRFVIDTVVPCSDPHLFQVLSIYEAPQAGGDYPGREALFQLGIARCPQAFLDRFGTDQAETSLSVLSFQPSEEEWDDQSYTVVCALYRADLQPLAGPIGDDIDAWRWQPGDTLSAVELQPGHCFDTPVPLEIQGFGQRVVFADCGQPHDGEYFDSVLLQEPDGDGYADPSEILADGASLCHDALHDQYGADHEEVGFTDTVLVQNASEYEVSPTNLLLCIVLYDEPTAGRLEDIASAS